MVRLSLDQCSVDTTEREVLEGGAYGLHIVGTDKGESDFSWGVLRERAEALLSLRKKRFYAFLLLGKET